MRPSVSGPRLLPPGPFRVERLRGGDELRRGHSVYGAPSSPEVARAKAVGYLCLRSDPRVRDGGVDVAYELDASNLVAPHVSVGDLSPGPGGWPTKAPSLALEYVGPGHDEAALQSKIGQLLGAGTAWVWVVRLVGPRRVEIYRRGQARRIKRPGARLAAPGVLEHAPPVEALYERAAAFEQALQNLLARKGYANLDALRDEGEARGEARGRAEALLAVLETRGLATSGDERARILDCGDVAQLEHWLRQALTIKTAARLFVPAKRLTPPRAPRPRSP